METPATVPKSIRIIQAVAISTLFVSLVAGQLIRFPLPGQGGGVLVSDIAIVLFVSVAMLVRWNTRVLFALFAITPFLLWNAFIVAIRSDELGVSNTIIALLYFIRLASILLLYPAGLAILQNGNAKQFAKKTFVYAYVAILLFGFLQLLFFPTLEGFGFGWDPHMYRMVGTWLDPNFFGAFLTMGLPAAISFVTAKSISTRRSIRIILFLVSVAAILLTKSRSTYVAAAVALSVCGVFYLSTASISRKWKQIMLPICITACILFAFTAVVLQERATQLLFRDPTVTVRLEAYADVWERLVTPNILFGVGYNAYQFAAKDAGLISDFAIHSRAGSDSSILTLLVTTGVIGAALFFIPMLLNLFKHYSLLYVWAAVFLLIHSLFVNSLLYPHLLLVYIVLALLSL